MKTFFISNGDSLLQLGTSPKTGCGIANRTILLIGTQLAERLNSGKTTEPIEEDCGEELQKPEVKRKVGAERTPIIP